MKNLRSLGFASALALSVIILGSCTKESLKKTETISRNVTTNNDPDPINQNGAVQAVITGETLPVSMVVYNNNFTSAEVSADDQGMIVIKEIPAGRYTVLVHVIPTDDTGNIKSMLIENVEVFADQITDLGTISFQ